jgi:hypothetical protein
MTTDKAEPTFRVWGIDNIVHDPIELPALIAEVRARKVKRNTWILTEPDETWARAADVPQLKLYFGSRQKAAPEALCRARDLGVTPESLRQIKVLAQMDPNQLQRLIGFLEVKSVEAAEHIVTRGSHGDAMYLILVGEARASITIDGKEILLGTLATGDFFGEISLLDQGPRSADVVANEQCLLLKLTLDAFERMQKEAPDVAMPFVFNVTRSVVMRMRALTRRYNESLHLSQVFTG